MPLPLTCSSKPVAVREKNVKNVARDFSKCQEECPCKNRCLPYLQERLKAGSGELWAPVPHLHPWLRHREPGLFILMEKILRGPLLIGINTWWGDLRKLRQTFFLWLSNDGTQEIPCKYKKKKKIFECEEGQTLAQVAGSVSIPETAPKAAEHGPRLTVLWEEPWNR